MSSQICFGGRGVRLKNSSGLRTGADGDRDREEERQAERPRQRHIGRSVETLASVSDGWERWNGRFHAVLLSSWLTHGCRAIRKLSSRLCFGHNRTLPAKCMGRHSQMYAEVSHCSCGRMEGCVSCTVGFILVASRLPHGCLTVASRLPLVIRGNRATLKKQVTSYI